MKRENGRYNRKNMASRLTVFCLGILLSGFGVALSTKCDLGITPISSPPYVLSLLLPLSMGVLTILMHALFVLLQFLLLRRKFELSRLLQIPLGIAYGLFIDLSLMLLDGVQPETYPVRLLLCLLSIAIIAFGVFLTVRANLLLLAGEGLMDAISRVSGVEFAKVKIATDSSLAICGVVISLIAFRRVVGVREGTILAMFGVGLLVHFYNLLFNNLRGILSRRSRTAEADSTAAAAAAHAAAAGRKPHLVVTFCREFSPAALKIAQRLSELTGLKVYDDELVSLITEESGLPAEVVRGSEERLRSGFLRELVNTSFAYRNLAQEEENNEIIFKAKQRVIRRLAESEDCIIIGRNANMILGKSPYYYHIYLHANPKWRIRDTMEEFHISESRARQMCSQIDAIRRRNCVRYTGNLWGQAKDFNLCLDIGRYSVEQSAQIIREAVVGFAYAPPFQPLEETKKTP